MSTNRRVVHMIGSAHLDPIWLWPWQAGADECIATFSAAAEMCETYPAFVFTAGEAWRYKTVQRLRPDLYARIRGLIERGNWHVTGGSYIQPDVNSPTAEALHKQFERGQAFFHVEFGLRCRTAYNIDAFGHPPTLPGILSAHGFNAYVFGRPRHVERPMDSQTFRWQGTDGTEVLAFRVHPSYVVRADDLYGGIMMALESNDAAIEHCMCFYGVGDHGGGPTRGQIEFIQEHRLAFDGVELRFSTPDAFFEAIEPHRDKLPVVHDELQEVFPGCYSVHHAVKSAQRANEVRAHAAERCLRERPLGNEREMPLAAELAKAWQDILFTQFHDILPGTFIEAARADIQAIQGRARIHVEEVLHAITRLWAQQAGDGVDFQQIVVANIDDAPFDGLIEAEPFLEFDAWGLRWLKDSERGLLPHQRILAQSHPVGQRVVFPLRLHPYEMRIIEIRDDEAPPEIIEVPKQVEAKPDALSNPRLRIEPSAHGIGQLTADGAPLLGAGGIGLHLREDNGDMWGTFQKALYEPVASQAHPIEAWQVVEDGPLRGRLYAETAVGRSRLSWDVRVEPGEPVFTLELGVVFAEHARALQMSIVLPEPADEWHSGVPGGVWTRRPGPNEYPVHGWAAVGPEGRTIGIATPDAYSASLSEQGIWQWTLLRSPAMGRMGPQTPHRLVERHADQGEHVFRFRFFCGPRYGGEHLAAMARQMTAAPVVFDRYEGIKRPLFNHDYIPRRLWTEQDHRNIRDGRCGLESVLEDASPLSGAGVRRAFREILGREPDSWEQVWRIAQSSEGETVGSYAQGLLKSEEYKLHIARFRNEGGEDAGGVEDG